MPTEPATEEPTEGASPDPEQSDGDGERRGGPSGARAVLLLLGALAVIAAAIGLQVAIRVHFLGDPSKRVLGQDGPGLAKVEKDTDELLVDEPWSFTQNVWSISLPGEFVDPKDAFKGQVNGLVGGAEKGALVIIPPRAHGTLDLQVQLLGHAPEDPGWCQDEVEVSHLFGAGVEMNNLDGSIPLGIPEGVYRVRYCASDQDLAAATPRQTSKLPGQYLLQLWPAGASGDVVIKQDSTFAQQRNAEVSGG